MLFKYINPFIKAEIRVFENIFYPFFKKMACRAKTANFRKNNQNTFFIENLILYKKCHDYFS